MGQMCWLDRDVSAQDKKILHLRHNSSEPWRPYHSFPDLAMPDHAILGGSKGWATYQHLRQIGWELVSTERAERDLLQTLGQQSGGMQ